MSLSQVLTLKTIGFLTPALQIILICALFIATTIIQYGRYKKTGKMWEHYPVTPLTLFVPIYEEAIFRGIILIGLASIYSIFTAAVVSSLLFGLWHLKNIFLTPKKELVYQMLYTGLVFGPVMSFFTIATGTIWLAVILHYTNNLFASYFSNLVSGTQNKKPLR